MYRLAARIALLALAVLLCAATPALCDPYDTNEIKFGVLAHDISFLGHGKESGEDVNGEFLLRSPSFLSYIWSPRPHIGIDVNSDSDTSNAYIGLTWTIPLLTRIIGHRDGLFIDLSEGPSINNGIINTQNPDRKSLGSNVLFRESFSLGYNLDEIHDVSLFLDHISNARLAERNEGITSLGARIGYKF